MARQVDYRGPSDQAGAGELDGASGLLVETQLAGPLRLALGAGRDHPAAYPLALSASGFARPESWAPAPEDTDGEAKNPGPPRGDAPRLFITLQDLAALSAVSNLCWHGAGSLAITSAAAAQAQSVKIWSDSSQSWASFYPDGELVPSTERPLDCPTLPRPLFWESPPRPR